LSYTSSNLCENLQIWARAETSTKYKSGTIAKRSQLNAIPPLRIQQTNSGHRIDKIELSSSFLTSCVSFVPEGRYFNISLSSSETAVVLIYDSKNTLFLYKHSISFFIPLGHITLWIRLWIMWKSFMNEIFWLHVEEPDLSRQSILLTHPFIGDS
jgi:hypothetical protein